ncbi:hypothetical protein P43SY_000964 [Pythium insidiosum]|uniref:CFA20 domain-containing protein n=1 Tax=Pythium insidiosum TaxID=114742 RepID=A0AAD5LBB6_PYTIN|nr:hypothetical protein P43SY_000964 [Pythium insidiosum]
MTGKASSSQSSSPQVSSLATSSSVVRIGKSSFSPGDVSFSPGDVYVECLLPAVQRRDNTPHLKPPTSSSHANDPDTPVDTETEVMPLSSHPVVLRAQSECVSLQNGNAVSVLEDEDVQEDVVEVQGNAVELVFPCRNIFRYLVLFIKNMEHFVELQVEVLDDQQKYRHIRLTNARSLAKKYRHIRLTNARSLAKVEPKTCQLPLVMGSRPGWRYLCMDLQDLTHRAFGSQHVTTTQLRIAGRLRLLRVFFQDELYADSDLPSYLTFLG